MFTFRKCPHEDDNSNQSPFERTAENAKNTFQKSAHDTAEKIKKKKNALVERKKDEISSEGTTSGGATQKKKSKPLMILLVCAAVAVGGAAAVNFTGMGNVQTPTTQTVSEPKAFL